MNENELYAIAYSLGELFFLKYKELTKKYLNKDGFINKNIKYFKEAVCKFSLREGYDAKKFIESFFYGEGIKYPPQIISENNWKKYLEYCANNQQTIDEERILAQRLISGVSILKKYKNVEDFLSNGKFYVNQIIEDYNDFDLLVFWFSKTFCDFYNETYFKKKYNPEIIRVYASKYPRILKKIKEILKEDCIL